MMRQDVTSTFISSFENIAVNTVQHRLPFPTQDVQICLIASIHYTESI